MLIFRPDFERRIDLPGIGPCRRPVDIDRHRAPLDRLVSLRVYAFDRGMTIDGEAEEDEVFVVLMRGKATVTVTAKDVRSGPFALRRGAERIVYLPPHAAYRLEAITDCDIAYARGTPVSGPPGPAAFRGPTVAGHATGLTLDLLGAGAALADTPERFVHVRSDDGGGGTMLNGEPLGDWASAVLVAGEPALLTISEGTVDILTISVAD